MVKPIAAAGLAAALCACGGLATPDLSRGAVSGVVAGASPGAYVYVYGAPQLRSDLAADGSFEIDGVPVGPASIILFDGADRAELVPVQVQGATRTVVARTASSMPVASGIVAAARPVGGTIGAGATYGVDGTVLAGLTAAAGTVSYTLWPLPAGAFTVRASLQGFLAGTAPVTALSGATVAAEPGLPVDLSAPQPGCSWVNNVCRSPLKCEPLDGWCYECVSSSDCTVAGETCVQHVCAATGPGARQICEPCASAADCASSSCYTGDPAGAYCSRACTADADCPAGFSCSSSYCVAPMGCASLTATFGAPCVENGGCDDTLAGGLCVGLTATITVGTCSAACGLPSTRDCSGAASAGLPNCTGGYCSP